MALILSILLFLPTADAGPLIAYGINSSRVVPGEKVSGTDTIVEISKVKTIGIGTISGPHSKTFINAAVGSINNEKQGRYTTGAESMAGVVAGGGKVAAIAARTAISAQGFLGAGMVGKKTSNVVEKGSEAAAQRMDGFDHDPEEGFAIRAASITPVEQTPTTESKLDSKMNTVATVANAVGAKQVSNAIEIGQDMRGVVGAFRRTENVAAQPKPLGVKLPIKAIAEGKGDASLSATIKTTQKQDRKFQETRKKKKRDKNGKVIKDKNGKVIWVTYKVDCIERTVVVNVNAKLKSRSGTDIMSSRLNTSAKDKQCGKNRMKKIASKESLSRPIVKVAASRWGRFVQPQMNTQRLKLHPTGTSALGVMYLMDYNPTGGMCILDDAIARDPSDYGANYNKAIILESYGQYKDAAAIFSIAYKSSELDKPRYRGGSGRMLARGKQLQVMEDAYGMVAEPTSFPYAAECPVIDIEGTRPITKRVALTTEPGGVAIRRLFVGERLRTIEDGKKWIKVQQIDGTEGWVKMKKAYK
jgi:hypothetical protein